MMVQSITRRTTTTTSDGVTRFTIITISPFVHIMVDTSDATVAIIRARTIAITPHTTVLTTRTTEALRKFINDGLG